MTNIGSLYKEYIQKSRLFLYPTLGIPRGVSVTPIQTYMEWDKMYTVKDCKLIAVYHLRNDSSFKHFESRKLLDNFRFDDFIPLEDNNGAYVFDFSETKDNYNKIVKGEYSKLQPRYKHSVLDFFKKHRSHHAYIESYLYPEKYFTMYSDLLNVNIDLLREVGELCSKPNFTDGSSGQSTEILDAKMIDKSLINQTINKKP